MVPPGIRPRNYVTKMSMSTDEGIDRLANPNKCSKCLNLSQAMGLSLFVFINYLVVFGTLDGDDSATRLVVHGTFSEDPSNTIIAEKTDKGASNRSRSGSYEYSEYK